MCIRDRLYTVTGAEYEAIHGCWCKAIKVLPDYSVVHKQDWFIKEMCIRDRVTPKFY